MPAGKGPRPARYALFRGKGVLCPVADAERDGDNASGRPDARCAHGEDECRWAQCHLGWRGPSHSPTSTGRDIASPRGSGMSGLIARLLMIALSVLWQ